MATLITVVELETKGYNSDGTTFDETLYFSSHPYAPAPGPPPSGGGDIDPLFNPRILTDPLKTFSMGCASLCSTPVQTLGDLELDNSNGVLEFLLTRYSKGLPANYYIGYDDQEFNTFINIGTLIQKTFFSSAEDRIKQSFVDTLGALVEPIELETYPDDLPNEALRLTPVPVAWGEVKNVKLEAYDKSTETWTVSSDGTIGTIAGVYSSGVNIPLGNAFTPGSYYLYTPAEGYQCIKFASNTADTTITIDFKSSETPGVDVFLDRLATAYGLTIDSTNVDDFNVLNPSDPGVSLRESIPGSEIINQALRAYNAWHYQGNDGEIKLGQLKEPSGDAEIFLSDVNVLGDFIKVNDPGAGLTTSLSFQKNWYVHQDNQVATSVGAVVRGQLLEEFKDTLKIDTSAGDFVVHDSYAFAEKAKPLRTTINDSAEALDALERFVSLYGGRRWFYSAEAVIDAQVVAALEPGDIVAMSEEDFNLTDPYDIDVHGQPLAFSGWLMHYAALIEFNPTDGGQYPTITDNLSTLRFYGNNWLTYVYPYTVTGDTLLEFDFQANTGSAGGTTTVEGEIIAIGVCTIPDPATPNTEDEYIFQIHGTENFGGDVIHDYDNLYTNNEGWVRYKIPIGEYFTGAFGFLRFAADLDAYGAKNIQDSRFRNVRLREKGFLNSILLGAEFNLGGNEVKLTTWGA